MEDLFVLVADDNAFIRELLRTVLESELGVESLSVGNGIEAIQVIDQSKPVLVVLDIEMPYVDGLEVARWMKANSATRDIPIILLTASDDARWQAQTIGCDHYLQKPFDLRHLVATIRACLPEEDMLPKAA
ncbi:MAG: response regulator [Chloroflexota bacterium]